MKEEVTGSWRKIHSQELIMCLPNTIRIIKSRQEMDRQVASVGDVGYTSLKLRRKARTWKTWV
jgi:hypothetical protein